MRRLLTIGALLLTLAASVPAQGPPDSGGAQPTPTPCAECPPPDGGGTNSVPAYAVLFVDGALIVFLY